MFVIVESGGRHEISWVEATRVDIYTYLYIMIGGVIRADMNSRATREDVLRPQGNGYDNVDET